MSTAVASPEADLLHGGAVLEDPMEVSLRQRAELAVHPLGPGRFAIGGLPHVFPERQQAIDFLVECMRHPQRTMPEPRPGCGLMD